MENLGIRIGGSSWVRKDMSRGHVLEMEIVHVTWRKGVGGSGKGIFSDRVPGWWGAGEGRLTTRR